MLRNAFPGSIKVLLGLVIPNLLHEFKKNYSWGIFLRSKNLMPVLLYLWMNVIVTGSAKTDTIVHFSNSCLLNIYNILSQVYPLAQLQPHMPITFRGTALQSSNNRKIDLTTSIRKINYKHVLKRLQTD